LNDQLVERRAHAHDDRVTGGGRFRRHQATHSACSHDRDSGSLARIHAALRRLKNCMHANIGAFHADFSAADGWLRAYNDR
jgi:hypothetical protein